MWVFFLPWTCDNKTLQKYHHSYSVILFNVSVFSETMIKKKIKYLRFCIDFRPPVVLLAFWGHPCTLGVDPRWTSHPPLEGQGRLVVQHNSGERCQTSRPSRSTCALFLAHRPVPHIYLVMLRSRMKNTDVKSCLSTDLKTILHDIPQDVIIEINFILCVGSLNILAMYCTCMCTCTVCLQCVTNK